MGFIHFSGEELTWVQFWHYLTKTILHSRKNIVLIKKDHSWKFQSFKRLVRSDRWFSDLLKTSFQKTFRAMKWTASSFFFSRSTNNYCLVSHPAPWELSSALKQRPKPLKSRKSFPVLGSSIQLHNCSWNCENIFLCSVMS